MAFLRIQDPMKNQKFLATCRGYFNFKGRLIQMEEARSPAKHQTERGKQYAWSVLGEGQLYRCETKCKLCLATSIRIDLASKASTMRSTTTTTQDNPRQTVTEASANTDTHKCIQAQKWRVSVRVTEVTETKEEGRKDKRTFRIAHPTKAKHQIILRHKNDSLISVMVKVTRDQRVTTPTPDTATDNLADELGVDEGYLGTILPQD